MEIPVPQWLLAFPQADSISYIVFIIIILNNNKNNNTNRFFF
jgi:hypothetical protein